MNRAQATEAAQRGERVERVDRSGYVQQLRWHERHGLQVQGGEEASDFWSNEGGVDCEYRISWTPRTFMGVWQEVKTFAEAEPAGCDGVMRFYVCHEKFVNTGHDSPLSASSYWVRRMPAEASEREKALEESLDEAEKRADGYGAACGECEEREELLDGLLDEALEVLKRLPLRAGLVDKIRNARAGK